MIKWISVKEYLPPFSLPVLVFTGFVPDIIVGMLSFIDGETQWKRVYVHEYQEFKLTDYWAKINFPEEEKTMTKWISVENRLPKEGNIVLAYFGDTPQVMIFSDKKFEYAVPNYGDLHLEKEEIVTHWMPLPEAPEEEV